MDVQAQSYQLLKFTTQKPDQKSDLNSNDT